MFRYCLLALLVVAVHGTTMFEEEIRIADELLGKNPKDNLKYIRPPGEPTNVTVNMYVRNIIHLCEEKKTWQVQLTFRQEWVDSRLAYTTTNDDFKYLPYGNVHDIWTPDLFFSDEITSEHHEHMRPNDLVRIYPSGRVVYSTRLTLKMFCPVDFHSKEVICPMRIASYAFTKEELEVHWTAEEPVQYKQNMVTPGDLSLKDVTTADCESQTKLGSFACILANFKFGHDACHA